MPIAGKIEPLAWGCGALAFGAPFVIYLLTLAPTVTFGDSGELITAAATLGIPHPSGYPLAVLAGQLFSLFPAGNPAWRVNLGSAAAMAAACLLAYLTLRRWFRVWKPAAAKAAALAAAAGALAFGFGRLVWSQAVIAEVYALNALAIAAALWIMTRWLETADARWGYVWALAAGLAVAIHTSSVLVFLPAGAYVAFRLRRAPSPRAAALALAFFLFGFFIYAYLPLRAVHEPALNWGDPRNLVKAWNHISRQIYGGPRLERLQFYPFHLRELAIFGWKEWAGIGIILALGGGAATLAARARPWGFLALLAAATGPLAAAALVLLLEGHQINEIDVWYIPFFLLGAMFAAAAVFWLAGGRGRLRPLAGGVLAAAAVVAPVAANYGYSDMSRYYYAEDYGANYLRTNGYNGYTVYFGTSWPAIFEQVYLKKVTRARPDYKVAEAMGLVFRDEEFRGLILDGATEADAAAKIEAFDNYFLSLSLGRPVYYALERRDLNLRDCWLAPQGLLYRVVFTPPDTWEPSAVWRRYRMRGLSAFGPPIPARFRRDSLPRSTAAGYYSMWARELITAGELEEARAKMKVAVGWSEGLTESLVGAAAVYFSLGDYKAAADLYEQARAAFPRKGIGDPVLRAHYADICSSQGLVYLYLGDPDRAAAAYRESLAANPNQPEIRELLRPGSLEAAAHNLAALTKVNQ